MFRRDVGGRDDEGGGCFDFYCSGFDGGGSRLRMIFRGDSLHWGANLNCLVGGLI